MTYRRWQPKKGSNGGIIATKNYPCYVCSERFRPNKSEIIKIKVGEKNRYRHWDCEYVPKVYEPDKNFTARPSQQSMFDWVTYCAGNLIVRARAGTGKTKTAEQMTYVIKDHFQSVAGRLPKINFVAFNKPIAKELEETLDPSFCQASTFHSYGYTQLIKKQLNPKADVDEDKLYKIIDSLMPDWRTVRDKTQKKEARRRHTEMPKLIQKMKGTLLSAEECVSRFGIRLFPGEFEGLSQDILEACKRDTNRIDFDDMIWLPYVYNLVDRQVYDYFIVDEVQDLNPVMVGVLANQLHPQTRFVGLGDDKQAIYAFRGASYGMMDEMVARFNCTVIGLPETFRCPKSHVEDVLNDEHVTDYVGMKDDPGAIYHTKMEDNHLWIDERHTIISRTNAPLVSLAFKLISIGKKATIKGKDFGKALEKFIDEIQPKNRRCPDIATLRQALEIYYQREADRLEKQRNPRAEVILSRLKDKVDCIDILCATDLTDELLETRGDEIKALKLKLGKIFDENVKGVGLYTIHKVKGMTVDHSVLLNFDKMPMYFPEMSDEDFEQEKNMVYVAKTRSRSIMTYCYEEAVPPIGQEPPEQLEAFKDRPKCKICAFNDADEFCDPCLVMGPDIAFIPAFQALPVEDKNSFMVKMATRKGA